jgi:hypothetical protein
MKLKYRSILIITISLMATFSGCKENHQKKHTKASIKQQDSASITILSTEGKLIRNFKYKYTGLNINSDSNEVDEYINHTKGYPKGDTIVGDFNGDGKTEKSWFKEKGRKAFEDCQKNMTKESCEGIILFSDNTIEPLKIEMCPMYSFKNEGDLYGNGKDIIGVLPGWFSSGCRQYSIYTLKNGKWKLACSPISNTLNMREAGIVLVEKDQTKKGWITIRESVDSYVFRVKNHKVPDNYIAGSCCQWSNVVEQSIKLN